MKYITIHISSVITSSQSISHFVAIFILTGIDHSSNVKQHRGVSGVVEKFTSCQSFCIIDYTTINDYDDVQMAVKYVIQNLWCAHVHTYLNGPFVAVITGKSTINILPLLAMVLLLFIITSDSIWLVSFEITGSMKQNAKMVHKYNYCMCFCVTSRIY